MPRNIIFCSIKYNNSCGFAAPNYGDLGRGLENTVVVQLRNRLNWTVAAAPSQIVHAKSRGKNASSKF